LRHCATSWKLAGSGTEEITEFSQFTYSFQPHYEYILPKELLKKQCSMMWYGYKELPDITTCGIYRKRCIPLFLVNKNSNVN
jgi:hypothetical protein